MQITPRDIALLQWINGFGFATTPQVARWMNTGYETARDRIYKLSSDGLLKRKFFFHREPGLLFLTQKGQRLCADPLAPLHHIRFDSYQHDCKLIELSFWLASIYPQGLFRPQRRIPKNKYNDKYAHWADGELHLPDLRPVAIELELTLKSSFRLTRILRSYRADLRYEQVWYYTTHPIAEKLRKAGADDNFCKIIEWEALQ